MRDTASGGVAPKGTWPRRHDGDGERHFKVIEVIDAKAFLRRTRVLAEGGPGVPDVTGDPMIPRGVEIFVALDPIDLRCYAELCVMRSS